MTRGRVMAAVAAVVAVLVAVAVAVVLLTRGDAEVPGVTPTATGGGAQITVWPLTGLPVTDRADPDHPAVAVKVSDVRQAHPHVGVDRADIVFVEPIGVSYTRLAAVFHSDVPETVGPVRSVRPMDAMLLSPMTPVLGSTMGADWVMRYVDENGDLDNLGSLRVRGSGAYVQDGQRPRPDDVMAKPRVLLDLSERTEPPAPYFSYATGGEPSSAAQAGAAGETVVVPYGPGWDVTWTYDESAGSYLRDEPWGPHTTVDGTQVHAENVLVLHVDSVTEKLAPGEGAPVPVLQLVDAEGEFVALADGRAVRGTWSKAGVRDPLVLRTDSGEGLLLSPGTTWVEMPTPDAEVVVR